MLSYFFGRIGRENIFLKSFLIYVHLSYDNYETGFCSKDLLIIYGLGWCLYYVVQFY